MSSNPAVGVSDVAVAQIQENGTLPEKGPPSEGRFYEQDQALRRQMGG